MKRIYGFFAAVLLLLLVVPALPQANGDRQRLSVQRPHALRVMTRNLYLGADILPVMQAAPDQIPVVVAQTFQKALATNFPARAEVLADEVAAHRPDLIGLQEVAVYRLQSPGDFLIGNPASAYDVILDYLAILEGALARRGLDYRVAAVVEEADVELPMFAGFDGNGAPLLDDIRLTLRDVVLAAANVSIDNVVEQNYQVNLVFSVAGFPVEFLRGFAAMDATVRERTYRFASTHLESYVEGPALAIQAAQAQELLATLAGEARPTVVVGDLNSSPRDLRSQPYWLLSDGGFVDVWQRDWDLAPPGPTCCQSELLVNPTSLLDVRIDHVFVRNDLGFLPFSWVGRTSVALVGDEPLEPPIPSQLGDQAIPLFWASDHAGVAATLRIPYLSR